MDRAAKKAPPKDPGGHKWKKLPKGWTDESRKKFWNSLTSAAPKHKVTQCIKRMEGKIDNPGAFCASLADRVIPGWRQEAAKERRKKKKAHVAKVLTELEEKYQYKPNQDGRGLLQMRYDYDQIPNKPTKDKPRSMIPGKDQLGLDKSDPLRLEKLGKQRDPFEPITEDKEKKGIYDEDADEEKPHSQMPGQDNLTIDTDQKLAQHTTPMGPGPEAPPKSRKDRKRKKLHDEQRVEGEDAPYSQIPGTDSMAMEEDHRVGSSQWITRSEMERLCPSCAVRMKKAGFTKVHVKVLRRMVASQFR